MTETTGRTRAIIVLSALALSSCKIGGKDDASNSAAGGKDPAINPPVPACVPQDDGNPAPSLSPATANVTFGGTLALAVHDGTAPYTFEVVSGAASVDSSGVFTASGSGTTVVQVTDAACRKAQSTLTVAAPATATPDDTQYNQLWGMSKIQGPQAWGIQSDCRSITVGIIDTGVDYTHPELASNMWVNPGEIAGNGIDDDANGFIDDVYGANFVDSNSGDPKDDHFHGTHVAGTVGARGNNAAGVTGVCWRASIMALKFLDEEGYGASSDAIEAIYYGIDKGAKILNNSWGGGSPSQNVSNAIQAAQDAGVLFIVAAGNGDANGNGINLDLSPQYPASYTHANVLTVAATSSSDVLTTWSNYGVQSVHVAAPGGSIRSTFPTYATPIMSDWDDPITDYATISGTSMAAPHVAGLAALLWSYQPSSTYGQIKGRIATAVDSPAAIRSKVIYGRIHAGRTLNPGY